MVKTNNKILKFRTLYLSTIKFSQLLLKEMYDSLRRIDILIFTFVIERERTLLY